MHIIYIILLDSQQVLTLFQLKVLHIALFKVRCVDM